MSAQFETLNKRLDSEIEKQSVVMSQKLEQIDRDNSNMSGHIYSLWGRTFFKDGAYSTAAETYARALRYFVEAKQNVGFAHDRLLESLAKMISSDLSEMLDKMIEDTRSVLRAANKDGQFDSIIDAIGTELEKVKQRK